MFTFNEGLAHEKRRAVSSLLGWSCVPLCLEDSVESVSQSGYGVGFLTSLLAEERLLPFEVPDTRYTEASGMTSNATR